MFSQDEYRGTFGPCPVINFTLEATTQSITHQQPHHTSPPLRRNSTRIGAPQSLLELVSLDWTSSISFDNEFLLSALLYPILHSRTPLSALLSPGWELLNSLRRSYNAFQTPYPTPIWRSSSAISTPQSHWCSAVWITSSQFHSALLHPPHSALLNLLPHTYTLRFRRA